MKVFYDNQPEKFGDMGNGCIAYRRNIREVEGETTQYECDETMIWKPLDKKKVVKSVIADEWDPTHEQKLVNEYNSVILGIIDGEDAERVTEAYSMFLTERKQLKAAVEADCDEAGIL